MLTELLNVPLRYDDKTKSLLMPPQAAALVPKIKLEIDQLNTLTGELIANGAEVPPVATAENFNKDMVKMIRRLYEGGVQAFRQGKFQESAKQFTIGVQMISRRHKFESFQGTLQELSLFLMGRSDAFLKTQEYVKAYNDADMLIGMQMCTPDNFLRRGVANFFLGNYEAARADYQRGLAFDENNERLQTELEVVLDKILEENGDRI